MHQKLMSYLCKQGFDNFLLNNLDLNLGKMETEMRILKKLQINLLLPKNSNSNKNMEIKNTNKLVIVKNGRISK